MADAEITECPFAKRRKLDENQADNGIQTGSNASKDANHPAGENEELHEQLRQFDVLDEVEGDGSGSEESGGGDFNSDDGRF